MFSASWIRYSSSQYRAGTWHGQFGRPGSSTASGQRSPLDRLSEAAESAPDCLLRWPHGGLRRANFTNANLTGATSAGANWNNAIWSNTCPDGTNSNNNGGTRVGHL